MPHPRETWLTEGKPWTKTEDRILRQWYRKYGANGVLKALAARDRTERSKAAVHRRANKLGIPHDPTLARTKGRERLVHATEVHPRSSTKQTQVHPRLIRAAERDGVIVKGEVYPHRVMVPESWADEYMDRLMQEYEHAEWLRDNWLDTGQVASLFGIARSTLGQYMSMKVRERDPRMASLTIYPHLDRIPREDVNSGIGFGQVIGTFWDPGVAKEEAGKYRARLVSRRAGNRGRAYARSLRITRVS